MVEAVKEEYAKPTMSPLYSVGVVLGALATHQPFPDTAKIIKKTAVEDISRGAAADISFEKLQQKVKEFEARAESIPSIDVPNIKEKMAVTSSSSSSSTSSPARITPAVRMATTARAPPTGRGSSHPYWYKQVIDLEHYLLILQHNLPRKWLVRFSNRERREYYYNSETGESQSAYFRSVATLVAIITWLSFFIFPFVVVMVIRVGGSI